MIYRYTCPAVFVSSKPQKIQFNEIKKITKGIRSFENRGFILKGTTRKIIIQEAGFVDFLRPFMTTALTLMKSVPIPLTKSILVPSGLTALASATNAAIQKKMFGSGMT